MMILTIMATRVMVVKITIMDNDEIMKMLTIIKMLTMMRMLIVM